VQFTQVVVGKDSGVECEDAKDEVAVANAEALDVDVDMVEVSGSCSRRSLAESESWEFIVSILTEALTTEAIEAIEVQIAQSDYLEKVQEKLASVSVESSSQPVRMGEDDTNDNTGSADANQNDANENTSESEDAKFELGGLSLFVLGFIVLFAVCFFVMFSYCAYQYCCGNSKKSVEENQLQCV